jgi:hypothetical protein
LRFHLNNEGATVIGATLVQEAAMSDNNLGEIIRPGHCRVSVSADKKELAFTFGSTERTPVTMILPILGAAGLQRQLAQCLYILGVRQVTTHDKPVAEPAAMPE